MDVADPTRDLIVRRVMPVDLRATAELLTTELSQRGRRPDAADVRNIVQRALEDASVLVVGAYHENQPGFAHGKMVGVLVMSVGVSIEHGGEAGWIKNLFVRPEYRRRGLAERLLAQALTFAETRGLRVLDMEVGEGQEPEAAHQLYQKYGFAPIRSARLSRRFPRQA